MTADRAVGVPDTRILTRSILPHTLTPLIVAGTLGIATAILDAAALSFLGLGAQPPMAEWGSMLGQERNQVFTSPHLVFFPGLMIMLTVLAFNLLGDGLRDALDPRLRKGGDGKPPLTRAIPRLRCGFRAAEGVRPGWQDPKKPMAYSASAPVAPQPTRSGAAWGQFRQVLAAPGRRDRLAAFLYVFSPDRFRPIFQYVIGSLATGDGIFMTLKLTIVSFFFILIVGMIMGVCRVSNVRILKGDRVHVCRDRPRRAGAGLVAVDLLRPAGPVPGSARDQGGTD